MNYSNFKKIIILLFVLTSCSFAALDFGYHNYVSFTSILKNYASKYPTKTYLYSIGKSVQNRELWVLALADSNPDKHMTLRPEVKYIGNMHGNEVPSKEILLQLIDYMLTNQANDKSVDYLMKNTRIHIMVSMNPDGFERSYLGDCSSVNGRYNANNYDLNRNFPDYFSCNTDRIQPETQSVINWLNSNEFILSANFHGGSMVVNYPFDNIKYNAIYPYYSATSDDDVFKWIALNYSINHPTMRKSPCGYDIFSNGITNGAAWYPVLGGMQDYNYWRFGCYETTVEISCCKYPRASALNSIWLENQRSLIEYLKIANRGIRGVIKFTNGQLAVNLTVKFGTREPYFKTNKYGEYYRILLPGTYKLDLMLNCTQLYSTQVIIPAGTGLVELNITLSNTHFTFYSRVSKSLNKYGLFCSVSKQPVSC
jgi:hypothetical protein